MRIIEIGAAPCFKVAFPDETVHFSTCHVPHRNDPAAGWHVVNLLTLPRLHRSLQSTADLVVCNTSPFSPWHWKWLGRVFFDRRTLQGNIPLFRLWGPQLLRLPRRTPLAVLDMEDYSFINPGSRFLLDHCRFYFKRELPPDHWRLFAAGNNLPSPRMRRDERFINRLKKLKPMTLGMPHGGVEELPKLPQEKTVDVFFAGRTDGYTVRERGIAELLALRNHGIKVDILENPLPRREFYERCARAWLVWSPEGYGWQCFRHYEAPACGSVPVINQPTIEQSFPLRHNQHAILYDIEPGGLTAAIKSALADKSRLTEIAHTACSYVLAHHTPRTMAEYVIKTTLSSELTL